MGTTDRHMRKWKRRPIYAFKNGQTVLDGYYWGSGSILELLISCSEASTSDPVGPCCGESQIAGALQNSHKTDGPFLIFCGTSQASRTRYSFLPMVIRLHAMHVKWYTKAKTLVDAILLAFIGSGNLTPPQSVQQDSKRDL